MVLAAPVKISYLDLALKLRIKFSAQHRRVKEESKGLKIEVQFDKMANDDSDAENDTDVANAASSTITTSTAAKGIVKNNSFNKLAETAATGFQEFNPLGGSSHGTAVTHVPHQHQQVPVVTANSWTAPIMTTLPVAQWANDPAPAFSQTQPAHWSHQQDQHHQPMMDPFSIGTWGQPTEPAQPQSWTGDWSNEAGLTCFRAFALTCGQFHESKVKSKNPPGGISQNFD